MGHIPGGDTAALELLRRAVLGLPQPDAIPYCGGE